LIFKGFKGAPQTVGEHIRKKRLADGLLQRELAVRFGVDAYTLMNWERGHIRTIPAARMPGMIAYLGFNREPMPYTVGDQLKWKRRSLGLTTREAARRNGRGSALRTGRGYPRFKFLVSNPF
jgi:DNA-binding XRE family transcriptional regulator